jgi:ubiquitin carboxyl-terminal hydrolase 25
MEQASVPAVTPALELAKLALVTSKDEEEEDQARGGTGSSTSTDATLVDEPAPMRDSSPTQPKSPSPAPSGSSVLGKRVRGFGFRRNQVNDSGSADETDKSKDDFVLISRPSGSNTPVTVTADDGELVDDGDVQMSEGAEGAASSSNPAGGSGAPPLPPRPKTQASGSDMMFGKQHDVAECMDNCMFQIETALLRLGELVGPESDGKRSIVKQ